MAEGDLSFFELGTGDFDRARAFYAALFDWEFTPSPAGGASIETPGVPGGIHTGDVDGGPYVFFAVSDLDAALAKVKELGGTVKPLDDNQDNVEKFGRFALCEDDQGSAFGLHEKPG